MDAFSRRALLHGAAAVGGVLAAKAASAGPLNHLHAAKHPGWVFGRMTGAQGLTEALLLEGTGCVYGIPGAQGNELWDTFKSKKLPYLLVTHEYSAACMADGYARSTGKPGVLCVVPGPGITNCLTGLGEALLDSVPVVAIVGDVGIGAKAKPFQVHALPNVDLLRPVCKCVYPVQTVEQIPAAVRQAFAMAASGEPGPVAVVVPYNLLIEAADYRVPPVAVVESTFDETAFQKAVALLADRSQRVGIYAGFGCMDYGEDLAAIAEMLQAPVATSVSGKGVISESHPLAVGWGFGPHASEAAEVVFAGDKLHPRSGITTLLAIGVKFSEVSTGYYGNPQPKRVIHVDANPNNLGRVLNTDVCVTADAGAFLARLKECGELRRPADAKLCMRIKQAKAEQARELCDVKPGKCGIDPLAVIGSLRRAMPDDGLLFTDVSVSEHLAAEHYRVCKPRTYFNPVDNQSMGWSIPAAIGAQKVHHGRAVATLTGDGCFLMSAMEISTTSREGLPVKFFILDDHAYHYMQMLQKAAYARTTATHLAPINYQALATAFGVAYQDIASPTDLDAKVRGAFEHDGPVLTRISTDYGDRKIRWIESVRKRYSAELSASQKARFLARLGGRALNMHPEAND
jgi:acetolactate synthase-1/2/3 large subunit